MLSSDSVAQLVALDVHKLSLLLKKKNRLP